MRVPLTIKVDPEFLVYMEDFRKIGLYGETTEEVARELIRDALLSRVGKIVPARDFSKGTKKK